MPDVTAIFGTPFVSMSLKITLRNKAFLHETLETLQINFDFQLLKQTKPCCMFRSNIKLSAKFDDTLWESNNGNCLT